MELGATEVAVRTGRTLRGIVAAIALALCSLGALLLLTWSCCSSPTLEQRLSEPILLLVLAGAVVALAAFPPLSRRLRARGVRWSLGPFVLADLALCIWLARLTLEGLSEGGAGIGEALQMLLPALLANGVCALYVGWRMVLAPGRVLAASVEPGSAPEP